MAVTPIRNMRVDDERWAAWGQSAVAAGVSITELVVTTMDNAGHSRSTSTSSGGLVLEPAQETIVVEGPVGDVPAGLEVTVVPPREADRRPGRERSRMCVHRIPESSYCRWCDGG